MTILETRFLWSFHLLENLLEFWLAQEPPRIGGELGGAAPG